MSGSKEQWVLLAQRAAELLQHIGESVKSGSRDPGEDIQQSLKKLFRCASPFLPVCVRRRCCWELELTPISA